MGPDFAANVTSAIRSMEQTVIPAVDPKNSAAQEQAYHTGQAWEQLSLWDPLRRPELSVVSAESAGRAAPPQIVYRQPTNRRPTDEDR